MQLTTLGVVVAALFGHVTVVSAQMVAYKNASGPNLQLTTLPTDVH